MSKKVIIKRLTLANFKGLRSVAIEFSDNVTTISGRNGTGKTTVMDAFTWLLWGKDSEGNTDTKFGIKTNDTEGNFIPDLEHEVAGTLEVIDTETGNIETVELRRVLVEEWKTEKGKTERKLKGHHTDYFYNGVPLKTKGEYDERINAIIPEAVFKMLTNPYYFLSLHWTAQREMLLQIAGGVSYEDVAQDNKTFAALIEQLSGKTVEDYKRELAAQKDKISKALEKIPTRIDEITRATPITPDYNALNAEKEQLIKEIDDIDEAATSAAKANRIAYEAASAVQKQINEKRSSQQAALFNAKENARNEAYKKNEVYNNADRKLQQIIKDEQNAESRYRSEYDRLTREGKHAQKTVEGYEQMQNELRDKWYKVNAEELTETANLVCPLFKHACADPVALAKYNADHEAARQKFYEDREERLNKINGDGKRLSEMIATQKEEVSRIAKELDELETSHNTAVAKTKEDREALQKVLNENPRVSTDPNINGEDLPEWVALEEEIKELSAQLPAINTDNATNTTEVRQRKESLTTRLDEVKRKLNLRPIIEANENRIKELNKEAAKLAQERADLQGSELVVADFIKARMSEVERRVNELFSRVQFKMYKTLVNGEEEPDCICLIDGVRYADKNAAGKVNAGLDIINTLCAFHDVSAPIFVDNAESINEFIPVASQLIRLVVTTEDFKIE